MGSLLWPHRKSISCRISVRFCSGGFRKWDSSASNVRWTVFPWTSSKDESLYSVPPSLPSSKSADGLKGNVVFAANTEKKSDTPLLYSWIAGRILLRIWFCLLWSNSVPPSSSQSLLEDSVAVNLWAQNSYIKSKSLQWILLFSKDHRYAKKLKAPRIKKKKKWFPKNLEAYLKLFHVTDTTHVTVSIWDLILGINFGNADWKPNLYIWLPKTGFYLDSHLSNIILCFFGIIAYCYIILDFLARLKHKDKIILLRTFLNESCCESSRIWLLVD